MSAKELRIQKITGWQGFHHITNNQMAGLAGVSLRTWNSWKENGFDLPVSRLTELCEYLRMPTEDLVAVLTAESHRIIKLEGSKK